MKPIDRTMIFLICIALSTLCFLQSCGYPNGDTTNISVDNGDNNTGNNGDTQPIDTDGDGIMDSVDNCVFIDNPNQTDTDIDGIGDVCDPTDDSVPVQ